VFQWDPFLRIIDKLKFVGHCSRLEKMKQHNSSRRRFLSLAGLTACGLSLRSPLKAWQSSRRELIVYVGTYTTGRSEGIYVCRLDLSSGELKQIGVAKGVANPSFLTLDAKGRFLYAVNEVKEFEGKAVGAVSAFSIERATGGLKLVNQQSSGGAGPCHLALDGSGKFLLVANYDAGSFEVLPIRQGGLGAPIDIIQHRGSSVNPQRQPGPHAHCVATDKNNRRVFVTDLGLDKIMIYEFDERTGKLTRNQPPSFQTKPGAGPRHFALHNNGLWAYVISELDSTMSALAYDRASGELKETQTVSTLPADFTGKSYCAELQVAPSGKFLYGSNRGHDSIVVYSIDQTTGKLSLVEHISTQGKVPRNFAIAPGGRWLLAANQNSDSVVSFAIDPKSGKLSPSGHSVEIPVPVCVAFLG
jgi:6-phosphogluconolactonase